MQSVKKILFVPGVSHTESDSNCEEAFLDLISAYQYGRTVNVKSHQQANGDIVYVVVVSDSKGRIVTYRCII